ncbi:site-specific DNA-methyltransferase [Candidatus Woesearchaeota archaeon]|nr:site-specific DNA-methyltransferase [Candidatus Woesearchaeota archaeon]
MDSEGNYETPQEEALTVQEQRTKYGEEKPKAKDTARLIWASKPKKEPNAKELDFQTAEIVYPNAADAQNKKLSSFTSNTKDVSQQPNRLIWGDNLLVMQALLAQGYEGQIDLIYIDPPFNTGENFNFSNEVKIGFSSFEKELPISERLAYTDTWKRGIDSFLDMLYPRLQLIYKLLSNDGTLWIHLDEHTGHYVRVLLDEIFGYEHFLNEIIWHYPDNFQGNVNRYANNHNVIFVYKKSEGIIKRVEIPLDKPVMRDLRVWDKNLGKIVAKRDEKDQIIYKEYTTKFADDVWQIGQSSVSKVKSKEHLGYPTQKPEEILRRVIESSSKEGNIIADFFCGSGTTAAVAEKLGRRWISADLSKTAIQVTRSRLVKQGAKPFIIENLGNYQRQLIYAKEVNLKQMYDIVLKLYGAAPLEEWKGFGISKDEGRVLVFVCEPDRPMTARKAVELARAARTMDGKGYRHLVILAWDYELDFDDTFNRISKTSRIDMAEVEFKVIPSDVYRYLRSTKVGDTELANKIEFYQKPYLRLSEPQIVTRTGDDVRVKIKIEQYVVKDIPLKDESKRPEIEKLMSKNFAYLIDYWTIDWEYDGETFRSRWQAIRDRKSGEPVPVSADATLRKGQKYTIAIRAVDVFGNDASMTKEIDLR